MLKTIWLTYVNHHECVWYGPSVTPRYEQRLPSHLFWSASEHYKISSVYFFSNEPKLILWISFLKIYILLPIFQIFGILSKRKMNVQSNDNKSLHKNINCISFRILLMKKFYLLQFSLKFNAKTSMENDMLDQWEWRVHRVGVRVKFYWIIASYPKE